MKRSSIAQAIALRKASPRPAPTAAPTVVVLPLEEASGVEQFVAVTVAVATPDVPDVITPVEESAVRFVLNG